MSVEKIDEDGKLFIPESIRREFGDVFRIVKFDNSIRLIPVSDNPVDGLRDAMKDIDKSVKELKEEAREAAKEVAGRPQDSSGEDE